MRHTKKEITSQKEILEKAREIATSQGLQAVNMRYLSECCGVALGTLYHYYPSKEALISALIEDFWRYAFHSSTCSIYQITGFLPAFSQFYRQSAQAFQQFESSFVQQMVSLRQQAALEGGFRQEWYFSHIIDGLTGILKKDTQVKEGLWTEVFTARRFVTMLVEEMLRQLRQQEPDPEFLLTLIEITIYKKETTVYASDYGNTI